MLTRVTVRNFKRFREQVFDLPDSVVLVGPNNAGKTTLLQALTTWRYCLEQWVMQRSDSDATKRSGVAVSRTAFTSVPLREMNLLWEDRKVTGPKGAAGAPRMIELIVDGKEDGHEWSCGLEIQYSNPEFAYVRPLGAKDMAAEKLREFPPKGARDASIVHVPALSGIEQYEPRRERGFQDHLIGQGRPGDIIRNLLLEISMETDDDVWRQLQQHISDIFGITLHKPEYSEAQPYIICEYDERGHTRPLDLSNLGSGTLQVLLLFAFFYARSATIVLLDEPDSHQHVILQRQVHDLVNKVAKQHASQVIVATHSEVILDASEPTRVLGFFGASPRRLSSESERDQLREAMKRITTTELMLAQDVGAILYVEGSSDESILREWARTLEHPAQVFFDRPFIRWLGGRRLRDAREHLFALQAVLPQIPAVCLLDGDNREEDTAEVGPQGMSILRWSRYEIENYLLQPEAIKRFINFALRAPQVDMAFDRQVPQGIDLFGDHAALARIKASDEFLIPLLQDVETPTPKSQMYLLAATMTADEIHPEVTQKLDAIAEKFKIGTGQEPELEN